MTDLIETLWMFLLENPTSTKVQTLLTSLKNFSKYLDNFAHLDDEHDLKGFASLTALVSHLIKEITSRKLQSILIS